MRDKNLYKAKKQIIQINIFRLEYFFIQVMQIQLLFHMHYSIYINDCINISGLQINLSEKAKKKYISMYT